MNDMWINNNNWIVLDILPSANGEPVLLAIWNETCLALRRGYEVRAFTEDEAKHLYDQGKLVGWTPNE